MKIVKLRKLFENLNPSEIFSYKLEMTRDEISKDISRFIGKEIHEIDTRLTDELCETWLTFDIDFVSKTQDDRLIRLRNSALNTILKDAGFEIKEKKKSTDTESSISEDEI